LVSRFHAFSAWAGWTGLVLLFCDITAGKHGLDLVAGIVSYFSYFTILSNILVSLIFTCAWVRPRSRFGQLLMRPSLRAGAAIYITVTAVVYILVLSNLSGRGLVPLTGTVLLHYVVPALYVFDWLVLAEKGRLVYSDVLSWLTFPLVYAVYTLVRGAVSGEYPYNFMDVTKLGYPQVVSHCVLLLITFVVLGFMVVALDRMLPHTQADR